MEDAVIARAHDLTGIVLGGRYEVLGKLGVGGMASVYEGRRVGLHNRVAIKVLRADLCEDPSNVKRFIREARASSVIEHENIVDIVDFGPTDTLPVYFVMEFLEGIDLRQEIKANGRMGWNRARRILLQVVGALGAAHAKAIVHRDVKPANIFLIRRQSGEEVAKVLDFGIAKVVEETMGGLTRGHTMTNGLLGTVAYMAPEQARGGTIDARTDVYAVGCVAFQMLTGQAPFRGNNPYVVLEQHVSEPPRRPTSLAADLPPEAEEIVLRCLEKAPENRFQSMAELAEVLAHGTTREYGKQVAAQAPGWNAPHPAALESGAAEPRQRETEALGSGSSHRSQGIASASYPIVATSKVAPLPGATVPLPQAPASRPTMPTPVEAVPKPRSRAMLPALVGLGVGLGLLLSLGIVFFVLEPKDEDEPVAPAAAVQAESEPNESSDTPEAPDLDPSEAKPTEPEPNPAIPEPEVVIAEPKPATPDAQADADEPEVPKPRKPTRPRRPRQRPATNPATPATTDPPPKQPDRTPDKEPDKPLHPDLRNPYG